MKWLTWLSKSNSFFETPAAVHVTQVSFSTPSLRLLFVKYVTVKSPDFQQRIPFWTSVLSPSRRFFHLILYKCLSEEWHRWTHFLSPQNYLLFQQLASMRSSWSKPPPLLYFLYKPHPQTSDHSQNTLLILQWVWPESCVKMGRRSFSMIK